MGYKYLKQTPTFAFLSKMRGFAESLNRFHICVQVGSSFSFKTYFICIRVVDELICLQRQRLATALLPLLFGTKVRSHHKRATGRVQI